MFTHRRSGARARGRWRSLVLAAALVLVGSTAGAVISQSPQAAAPAHAATGSGTAATMADYWAGNAQWTYVRKNVAGVNSVQMFGNMVHAMPDGSWYLFSRLYPDAASTSCMDVQVRKSTDKGASWSAPVTIIPHTAGAPWACDAADGDAYYNANEGPTGTWHYIFQCSDGGAWRTCELARNGSDPMGPFTIPPTGGNPLFAHGALWQQICSNPAAKCATNEGGPGKVTEEGTFNFVEFDGTYYWVTFHGYAPGTRNFYRGVAKTADFHTWIAGDPSQGTPADAIHGPTDTSGWRESWDASGPKGTGAGSMVYENGYYYDLDEVADGGMDCSTDDHWDWGLFRSSTLNNSTWDQFPGGNPIFYSNMDGTQPRCNLTYGNIFRDPTDGFYYLGIDRGNSVVNGNLSIGNEGIYWYRLEKSTNVLSNADFWKADTSSWTPWDSNIALAAKRDPYGSPNGGQYLSATTSQPVDSFYQNANVAGGGSVTFGGKAMNASSGTGNITFALFQYDSGGNTIQTDTLAAAPTASWASYSKKVTLQASTTHIRYQVYLSDTKNYRFTDLVAQPSPATDTTAPDGVVDLKTVANGSGISTLTWTAPGDDGGVGTAASYDVRYSTSPITAANWSSASQATGAPTPLAGGNPQTMQISGLSAGTNYYYAIETTDAAGNVSPLSNVTNTVGTPLYADNFSTLSSAWTNVGGTWTTSGNTVSQTSTASGDPKKLILSNSGITYPDNVTLTAKVRVDNWGTDPWARAGISLDVDPASGQGYSFVFNGSNQLVFINDGVAAGPTYPFTWTAGTWYWFKLKVDSGVLYAKVWQDGTTEPTTWPYSWERFRGRIGVPALVGGSSSGTGTSNTTSFSNVAVSANSVGDYTPDLAIGKAATSSGVYSSLYQAQNATDGNDSTRWASNTSGATWVQVDLGSSQTIHQIKARWETGGVYSVQVSTDGVNYTTVTGTGSTVFSGETSSDTFSPVSARYVRISAPSYRSIYSINVY